MNTQSLVKQLQNLALQPELLADETIRIPATENFLHPQIISIQENEGIQFLTVNRENSEKGKPKIFRFEREILIYFCTPLTVIRKEKIIHYRKYKGYIEREIAKYLFPESASSTLKSKLSHYKTAIRSKPVNDFYFILQMASFPEKIQ